MADRERFCYWTFIVFVILTKVFYLGYIPQGTTVQEEIFGNFLAHYVGESIYVPFLVRLPFAILGVLTVIFLFETIFLRTKSFYLAIWSSFFFAFSPWVITESRIFSVGTLLSFLIVVVAYIFRNIEFNGKTWLKFVIPLTCILFLFSVLFTSKDVKEKVDFRRNIASHRASEIISKVSINRYTESIHLVSGTFLGNFDFGNYFFGGHPRQRWGVEETQKLLPIMLPVFLWGIVRGRKSENILYLSLFLLYSSLLTAFKLVQPTFGLPLIFIFSVLIARGYLSLSKIFRLIVMVILVFELSVYLYSYRSGKTETMFSPRSVERVINIKL